MKITKYLIASMLFLGLVSNFTACKDDDDDPEPTPTNGSDTTNVTPTSNEELEKLGVDALYSYNVSLNLGASYEGKTLQIDIVNIAKDFGLDTASFNSLIKKSEIVGYTYDPVEDRNVMTPSTTNSDYWGHWFTTQGQITAWSESLATDKGITYNGQAAVYCEYDVDTYTFYYGQYPGIITENSTITVYECLYSEDLDVKVAVKIIFNIAKETLNPTEVGSEDIEISVVQNTDYSIDNFEVKSEALSALGLSSFSEATFVAYASETELDGNTNADPIGFWYGKNGYKGAWGNDASIFVIYSADDNAFGIGQMPNTCSADTTVNVKFGVCDANKSKVYWLNLKVTISGYQDPETAPTGEPESATYDLILTKPYTTDYAAVSQDVADQLKNAFKMTNYQIYKAVQSGDFKMYVNEKTDELKYTATAPGYWLDKTGAACAYADGVVYLELSVTETGKVFNFGCHPDNAPKDGTLDANTNKIICECNGVTVTYNVKLTITAEENSGE